MTPDNKKLSSAWKGKLQASGISAIFLIFLIEYMKDPSEPACIKSIGRLGTELIMCGIQAQLVIGLLGLISAYLWFFIIKEIR